MRHSFIPEDLQNELNFELIDVVSYQNIKQFILNTLKERSRLIFTYSIIQLLAIIVAFVVLVILLFQQIKFHKHSDSLKWFLSSFAFSFTLLIPIHEIIHALAFLILGKRNIGFGVQLKKFIFYAEADKQVMDKKEMGIVAFAPLIVVGFACFILCMFRFSSPTFFFYLGIFLLHFIFCAGDMAIVAYFSREKHIYSYDNRNEKKTFFYRKKRAPKHPL